MNKLLWQLKRSLLLLLLTFLKILNKIGSGPDLLFGILSKTAKSVVKTFRWLIKLLIANLKYILAVSVILLSWQIFLTVNSFLNSLPKVDINTINNLSLPPLVSIYDQKNNLLGESNRDYYQIPVNSSEVSTEVVNQLQDYRFYSKSLAEKLLTEPQSVKRLIKNNILSYKINKMFSKQQILTAYFNTLAFPNHIVGIEAASEYFLNKNASKLSFADFQYLIRLSQNKEIPKITYSLYKRAPDAVDFVIAEIKSGYPDIWQNNKEIKVTTSIDLKLQNYLQQFVLANLSMPNLSGLAIIDPDSRFLLALVGHPSVEFNKTQKTYSIKKITDLKQNILLQSNIKIPFHSPVVISLKLNPDDKNWLNKLNQTLSAQILDNYLVENKSEGR